ncbi:MAG TPA: dimethylmenaquinone methyltransferase [Acidimicrobiaceae bacterium]|nr:dimethylmenaquinone methyltransferase [Acidimicrobiaceae bacterium]
MGRQDPRAPALLDLGTATLGESGARVMPPRVRPAWPGARLAGPAFPVRCSPADNLPLHVAAATAPAGWVLVADVGGLAERGYWGEVLTTAACARELEGLVIDGGVRDVDALEAHGFPVFATAVALRGATKELPGTAGLATVVAGIRVSPGDWVVGDRDGVVVLPAGSFDEIHERAEARAEKERGMFDALESGSTTVELLGLDASPVRTEEIGTGSVGTDGIP